MKTLPTIAKLLLVIALSVFQMKCYGQKMDVSDSSCSREYIQNIVNKRIALNLPAYSDSLKVLYEKVLKCAKSQGMKDMEALILLELGRNEIRKLGPRDVPTRLFLESKKIYSEINDQQGIANCNLQLGVLNYDIRNYDAAIGFFNSILHSVENTNRLYSLASYLAALTYSELDSSDRAEYMFNTAMKTADPTDSGFYLLILTFKGKLFINRGDYQQALALYDSVMLKYRNHIIRESYSPIYAFLARAQLEAGSYKKAIENARKAYQFAQGKGSSVIFLREAENVLHKAYFAIGEVDSAYYYLRTLNTLEDSITSKQILQRITQMSGQFDFQQRLKAQQAEQLLKDKLAEKEIERQKLIRNLIFLGFILVGIFALIFFRQRTNIAHEKDRSEKLLLNILPEEIAEELKEKGRAEARTFENVSILFTDFVGFTQTSEKLSASELVEEINTCFEAFDHIVDKYGLEKIKTIGDAYMAAGGIPIPTADSAKNTALAAIEMQAFITEHKSQMQAINKPAFEMRAGMHTGPVVAGIVGVKKFQYDLWGDTVNTASRMESCGETGKVNISDTSYQILKNYSVLCFDNRGKVEVKGKGEMEMWFVELVST